MEGMVPYNFIRKKLTGKASSSATLATVSSATHTGASTEGLREDLATGTEVVGKYHFPGSAPHVST